MALPARAGAQGAPALPRGGAMPPLAAAPHARHPPPWALPMRRLAPAGGEGPAMPRKASGPPMPHLPWPGGT
eukprot:10668001-Alexandrium_andersonii.AAC.1